jgi:hypothetical protein
VYETAPGQYSYTRTDNYDRAWSAALGAMQDTGVQIVSSDPGSGTVRGSRNGAEVTVSVTRQADGTTRVAFNTRPRSGSRISRSGSRRRTSGAWDADPAGHEEARRRVSLKQRPHRATLKR